MLPPTGTGEAPVTEPVPPRWLFGGAPIALAEHETLWDKLCYATSRDLGGIQVFKHRDLTRRGTIPYGTPPSFPIREGVKVKVRWTAPTA